MKRRFFAALNNPLVLIPPIILVMGLGWQQYTYAGLDLALPSEHNVFPDGTFSSFNAQGVPIGWQIISAGDLQYKSTEADGHTGGDSFKITVNDYQNGNLAVTGPKVAVKPDTTYLFKGYYTASAPFSLLTRYYFTDGSSDLRLAETYPSTSGWSTVSDAFATPTNIQSVQFVYHMYHNGELQINGLYLEPRSNVYIQPIARTGTNVLPNSTLSTGDYDEPKDWLTYHTGDNTAAFSYQADGDGRFIQAQVTDYKTGEAKWQHTPQPVQAHKYYRLSIDYWSTIVTPIVAEYVLEDGTRQVSTIGDLPPADDWTAVVYKFEVPPRATSLFVSVPLKRTGTVASRNYQLIDTTRSGAATWQHPTVSITLDDGWQSSYDNAIPLLKHYGYNATFYVNPPSIETPHFMTAAELTALKTSGNEIESHSYDHKDLTTLKTSAVDYQLRRSRDYLRAASFQVTNLATPYGRSDPETAWYARKYFATVRSTANGLNTRQNLDPYALKVLHISNTTSAGTIARALEQAKAMNGWLILVYHQVGDDLPVNKGLPAELSTTSIQHFREQLEQINSSGIRVLPIAAAYAELEQQ